MKPLFLFIVFFVIAGNQVVCAEDSKQVQHLEDEINVLRKAASDQSQRIQSLENRVSSQGLSFSKSKSASSGSDSKTDDGQRSNKVNNVNDGLNQKYID
jgi:hypothetical protein